MNDDEKTLYINNQKNDDVPVINQGSEDTLYVGKKSFDSMENETIYVGKNPLNTIDGQIEESPIKFDRTFVNRHNAVQIMDDNSAEKSDDASETRISYYLPINTMLRKRYRIDSVLGEGGFGITYLGWDITLNIPVAIKEYYPTGLVTRNVTFGKTSEVILYSQEKYGDQFRDGIDRVLDEARRIAKFRNTPGIVSVYDFFEANHTAYIVMEYVTGCTLSEHCKNQRMDNITLFNLLVPVMDALSVLHEEGIIHRDISPDNIMVDTNGALKLLDFGAARAFQTENYTTMSIVLKQSYAPVEQYRTKGNQGPWTDEYALAATIYELLTGKVPPNSLDRLINDTIVNIRELVPTLTKGQAAAIMKALSVNETDRWQTIDEFKAALLDETSGNINRVNSILKEKTPLIRNKKSGIDVKVIKDKVSEYITANKRKSAVIGGIIVALCILCVVLSINKDRDPGFLGIYTSDIPLDITSEYFISEGVYISGVIENTPAAKTGFVAGDIIIALDNKTITSDDDFENVIGAYYERQKVSFTYMHLSNGEYKECRTTVKLANKNEQDETAFIVSGVSVKNGKGDVDNKNDVGNESQYSDLTMEFVGAEKTSISSDYLQLYLKINNPNDDTLDIRTTGIYLNDVCVEDLQYIESIVGGKETTIKLQVDHTSIIANQIGDEITEVSLQYNFKDETGNTRECIDTGFKAYHIGDVEVLRNDEQNNNDEETTIDKGKEDIAHNNFEEDMASDREISDAEISTDEIADVIPLVEVDSDIIITLSDIKYGSSYVYITFLIENNSDNTVTLTRDWVYVNDTSVKRTSSEGLLEIRSHEGAVQKYTFEARTFSAAMGDELKKLEFDYKINDSDDITPFILVPESGSLDESVARINNQAMPTIKTNNSKNIEVNVTDIKVSTSYVYVTYTVKNLTDNKIELGSTWTYFNGSAVIRSSTDGSLTVDQGKSTVIEYTFKTSNYKAAIGDELKDLTLAFYINDSEECEYFNFEY